MAVFEHEKREALLKKILVDKQTQFENDCGMTYDELALYKKVFEWGWDKGYKFKSFSD